MSIQRRLAISITLVLVFSLIVGFGLTYEHVTSKVRTELQAALAVSVQATRHSIDEEDKSEPLKALRRLVGEFNGDRHIRALLVAPTGTEIAKSRLLPPDVPAPRWFYDIVVSPAPRQTLALPAPFRQVGTLTLAADPSNEIAEAWSDTTLTLTVLAVFFAMVLALAFVTIRAALSPLRDVCAALDRIGTGDYGVRIDPHISHELAPLRIGFNAMAVRLEDVSRQNRALTEQMMTLQEEERAELARDLHDDVAPFLFAVGADAAMIRQFLARHATDEVAPRAEAIADAVKHMQRHLKDVLRRLAPGALLDLGLAGAIENLTNFWKARRLQIDFAVEVTGDPLDPPFDAVAFRVVQESISNAVRHGQPTKIDVLVAVEDETATVVVEDDGTGFASDTPRFGFGLAGMQERVRSVGGTLNVRNRTKGHGVIVEAVLPIEGKAQVDETRKVDVTV